MRLMLVAAVLMVAVQLCAQTQDTVRTDIDYRTTTDDSDKRASKPSNIYLSLQANQLLRQLFGGSGSPANPFLLTYGFNNKRTGRGLLFGLAYSANRVKDTDLGFDRETKNKNFNLRFGYDYKGSIGKRWLAGAGIDILLLRGKSFTDTNQGSETTTTTNGWGIGPRGTLLFHVSEKIYLGTETSWYFQSSKLKTKIVFPGSPSQESEVKESDFELLAPTAIFLTLKF
jgi:hypothetical protein